MTTKMAVKSQKYLVFGGLSLLLIGIGFYLCPDVSKLWEGFKTIATHPALLDLDALQMAGNFGTAFINSGLLLLCVLASYYIAKTDMQGVEIAAAMMVLGFGFYGKNLLNVWFPFFGVLLQAKFAKKSVSSSLALAWFSTALSPVFSVTAFGTEVLGIATPLSIGLGALLGITGGILVGILAGFLPKLHDGWVLFNAGFAAGLSGIFLNSIQKGFGIGHDRFPYEATDYVTGQNGKLTIILLILFGYLLLMGILLGGAKNYFKLFKYRVKSGNFVQEFGFATALINMFVVGMIALGYVHITGTGQLAGPVYGCIWTAVGFASNGVTVKQYLPTMLGVYLMCIITGGVSGAIGGQDFLTAALNKVGSRGMLLAAIFSCGLSPIVGRYGFFAGLFVGAFHSILAPNLGSLHGWMSLYNNGLSLSLIATLYYPVYSKLAKKEASLLS